MSLDTGPLAGRPVILGAGLAGLVAALCLAPRPVVVVTKSALDEGAASFWSQGGIAAAISPDDSPALHAADTLAAGDGLGDSAVVHAMTAAGPAAVRLLDSLGVRFARGTDGAFACKLEAAHSRRRVLNAGGDATGAEIMRAVLDAARRAPSVTILERVAALDLRLEDGAVTGIVPAGRAPSGVIRPIRPGPSDRGWPSRPGLVPRSSISNSCSSIRPRWMSGGIPCRSPARRCAATGLP
jgi:L-aspartate oxidase